MDDLDAVEASIEQQDFDPDVQGVQVVEKTLKYLIHSYLGCDSVKGQGMAFAVDHGLGGGVGKKVCSALLGFTSANLVLMLFLDRAMIGKFDEINGDLASSHAQALGDQTSQQGVERFFELIQVAELGGEFAQHGLASGGAAEVLTGFGDGNTGGSGEDQDMEEGGDLDLLATGHQRQVGQGVDSKIEDALTLQGLHTEAYTWGLETKGGKGFLSLSEPLCFFEDYLFTWAISTTECVCSINNEVIR